LEVGVRKPGEKSGFAFASAVAAIAMTLALIK